MCVADRPTPVPDTMPGLTIVEIGGNDMFGASNSDEFGAALDKLLTKLTAMSDRVVMVELPVLPGCRSYAVAQREVAGRYHVPLIPKRGFAVVLSQRGNTLDGVHLTQQGHDAMAAWVWSVIGCSLPAQAVTSWVESGRR